MDKLAFVGLDGDRDTDLDNYHFGHCAADHIFRSRKDSRCAAANLLSTQRTKTETRPVGSVRRLEITMTLQTKIYIGLAVAAIFTAVILGGAAWSNHKITRLEKTVEEAKATAISSHQSAIRKEIEAAEYKQKIEYLERRLTEIQITKRKQDEKLEKLNVDSRSARRNVERAKRTRTINADAGELCRKLAELGHACK